MFFGDLQAASAPGKCDLFADYFPSVFGDAAVPIPVFDFGSNDTVPQCVISATDVQSTLSSLDHNKGAGPNEISRAY